MQALIAAKDTNRLAGVQRKSRPLGVEVETIEASQSKYYYADDYPIVNKNSECTKLQILDEIGNSGVSKNG